MEGRGIIENIFHAIKGTRDNFKPSARTILKEISGIPISSLMVGRRPIREAYKKIVQAVSEDSGATHDQLFHLFLIVGVNDLHIGGLRTYIVEKNQELNIAPYAQQNIDEVIDLSGPVSSMHLTLPDALQQTLEAVGPERFYRYNAFTTNCQRFVLDFLEANNLSSARIREFVLQDVSRLAPHWAKKVGQFVTDIANRADILIQGYGRRACKGGKRRAKRLVYKL